MKILALLFSLVTASSLAQTPTPTPNTIFGNNADTAFSGVITLAGQQMGFETFAPGRTTIISRINFATRLASGVTSIWRGAIYTSDCSGLCKPGTLLAQTGPVTTINNGGRVVASSAIGPVTITATQKTWVMLQVRSGSQMPLKYIASVHTNYFNPASSGTSFGTLVGTPVPGRWLSGVWFNVTQP